MRTYSRRGFLTACTGAALAASSALDAEPPDGKNLASAIDSPLHAAADEVTEWPKGDLFGQLL